jgi:hypothetical protein
MEESMGCLHFRPLLFPHLLRGQTWRRSHGSIARLTHYLLWGVEIISLKVMRERGALFSSTRTRFKMYLGDVRLPSYEYSTIPQSIRKRKMGLK